jgi:predicted phosphodiesterase
MGTPAARDDDAPLRIGLLSDIHDHVPALKRALPWLQQHTDVLLVLGDLVAPFVMKQLGTHYTKRIHVVFGNNDGDLTACAPPPPASRTSRSTASSSATCSGTAP